VICAVGTDIVQIERIERAMRHPRFVERILTEAERQGAGGAEWVAGRWAAKEAAFKCLGQLRSWQDVEVLCGQDGRPVLRAPGGRWHVSISHDGGYALAFVVLER
jgi:holo-[acyl-carrier protein] synthase